MREGHRQSDGAGNGGGQTSRNKRGKRQSWSPGDCFIVPLADGSGLLGQVLQAEPGAMNSVSCAFYDQSVDGSALPGVVSPNPESLISVLFVTRELIDSGRWRIIGSCPICVPRSLYPYESLRVKSFVGAKIIGGGIVEKFANAIRGLRAWDDWHNPHYLDGLLISPQKKPANLVYKAR